MSLSDYLFWGNLFGGSEADHSMEDGLITGTITEYRNDRVESVADYMFNSNQVLERITLPSAKTVGACAFLGATKLKIVDLPTLTSASDDAFAANSFNVLKYVVIRSETAASVAKSFDYNPSYDLLVPRALVNSYIQQLGQDRFGDEYSMVDVRALEDYTVDGTITGELDLEKMGI